MAMMTTRPTMRLMRGLLVKAIIASSTQPMPTDGVRTLMMRGMMPPIETAMSIYTRGPIRPPCWAMKTLAIDFRIASGVVPKRLAKKLEIGLLLSIVKISKPPRLKVAEFVGLIFENMELTIISWTR